MYKSFGYPEFNASGEQILTTYNNEYSNMLFASIKLKLMKKEFSAVKVKKLPYYS